jgi:hypothetical protein
MRVAILACLVACGGKHAEPPAAGSGSAAAAAPKPVPSDAAQPSAVIDRLGFDFDDPRIGQKIAFEGRVPRLPAISGDGATFATFYILGSGGEPPPVEPVVIALESIENPDQIERLDVVDDPLAISQGQDSNEKPPPAAVVGKLRERAAAAIKVLRERHYASLVGVETDRDSSGDKQTAKIGDFKLTAAKHEDATLDLQLVDGAGKVVHKQHVDVLVQGTADSGVEKFDCNHRPGLVQPLRDAQSRHLYLVIRFWHNEMCDPVEDHILVWDLPAPDPDTAAISELVHTQFDTVPAKVILPTAIGKDYSSHEEADDVKITLARDGKSAWASVTTKLQDVPHKRDDPWRASDVLVKSTSGWQLAALAWTKPVPNADAQRDAKAGKLSSPPLADDRGDASLREAFAKLTTDGIDATAAKRADLVAIGSGPGERTVGPVFGKAWNAAWKGHVTIASSVASVAPSGTTGWVVARIELAKPGYKLPFFAFAVFDKTAAGEWSLVHIHFAV